MKEKKFIDIDEVFKSKNPKLYKTVPKFLLSYVKRIVHQDRVNDFIARQGHLRDFDFLKAIIQEFSLKIKVNGLHHLPPTGGCIVAANHPLGGLDAIALMDQVGTVRRDIKFIVNDILLQIKNLESLFVGVNKHGKNSKEALDLIDHYYQSGICMMIFPAGLVSRKQNGHIRDLEWRRSFVVKSIRYQLPIVPVHISGENTPFFYNLSKFRKSLGIKANVEMLFLVDEMYKQYHKEVCITFGKPLSPALFTKEYNELEWAQRIKEHVYAVGGLPNAKAIVPL